MPAPAHRSLSGAGGPSPGVAASSGIDDRSAVHTGGTVGLLAQDVLGALPGWGQVTIGLFLRELPGRPGLHGLCRSAAVIADIPQ
jgi:hypothetical protein